jgi:hypothetical protein
VYLKSSSHKLYIQALRQQWQNFHCLPETYHGRRLCWITVSHTGRTWSSMYAYTKHKLRWWAMSYLEARCFIQQIERHVTNLGYVSTFICLWQTTDNHVRITDCLHLSRSEQNIVIHAQLSNAMRKSQGQFAISSNHGIPQNWWNLRLNYNDYWWRSELSFKPHRNFCSISYYLYNAIISW